MDKPLVSVLMTAYNREEFIREAIESVLLSTYTNWELIVVDDCSVDRTVEIAKTYASTDSRIRIYQNELNLGDYANRNKAASYAVGEFIMNVDSDDKIHFDGIEKCLEVMYQFNNAEMGMYLYNKDCDPFQIGSNDIIKKHFFEEQMLSMGPGGTIIRRSFFERIKGYPVKYGPANDMYFNLKAACNTSLIMIPFEFLFYRRHDGQEINNQFKYLYNSFRYLKDALNELDFPLTDKQKLWLRNKNSRRFLVNLFNYFRCTKDFSKTFSAFRKSTINLKEVIKGILH